MEILEAFKSGNVLFIVAQIVGLFAMATSILSVQMKTYVWICIVQTICAVLFTAHYALMMAAGRSDAISGMVSNGIFIVRNLFFMFTKDTKLPTWVKALIFSVIVTVANLFFWGSWISIFCVAAMILNTVAMSITSPQKTRLVFMTSSPLNGVYTALVGSIPGLVNELFSFTSIAVAFFRYRRKEKKEAALD